MESAFFCKCFLKLKMVAKKKVISNLNFRSFYDEIKSFKCFWKICPLKRTVAQFFSSNFLCAFHAVICIHPEGICVSCCSVLLWYYTWSDFTSVLFHTIRWIFINSTMVPTHTLEAKPFNTVISIFTNNEIALKRKIWRIVLLTFWSVF